MKKFHWYNRRSLIKILLLMMPPLGLYRNKSIKSNNFKLLYAIIGFITVMILFMIFSSSLNKVLT